MLQAEDHPLVLMGKLLNSKHAIPAQVHITIKNQNPEAQVSLMGNILMSTLRHGIVFQKNTNAENFQFCSLQMSKYKRRKNPNKIKLRLLSTSCFEIKPQKITFLKDLRKQIKIAPIISVQDRNKNCIPHGK